MTQRIVILMALGGPITATACDVPQQQPVEDVPQKTQQKEAPVSACEGPREEVACLVAEGVKGPPKTSVIGFAAAHDDAAFCAEIRQLHEAPDRVTSLELALDAAVELLGPSAFNQQVAQAMVPFTVGAGEHTLEVTPKGTKKGAVELCLYRHPDQAAVFEVKAAEAGSFAVPGTGFEISWPAGAVAVDTEIWCEKVDETAVDCGPDGTTFAAPLIVSFPYTPDPEALAQALVPTIRRDDEPLLTTRAPTEGRMYASTTHFSRFDAAYTIAGVFDDHFAFFNPAGGTVEVPHNGATRPLKMGQSAIISFRKQAGHRYTITASSPPKLGGEDECAEFSFPAGDVDIFGYYEDPESVGSAVVRAGAKLAGWSSENTPHAEEIEIKNAFNKVCPRGTEDAFSVDATIDGNFFVLVDGVAALDNYYTLRIVESKIADAPGQVTGLAWPLDGFYTPTKYGKFNTTWGNEIYDPYYYGEGFEIRPDDEGIESPRYMIHDGVDIAAPPGTPVTAVCDGEVLHVGDLGKDEQNFAWHEYVIQKCTDIPNLTIAYGHIDPAVAVGKVKTGDLIGEIKTLALPGEPEHLHLGLCLGPWNGELEMCEPQRGASRDKWFPYTTAARKTAEQYRQINPDICTNPSLWADKPPC